MVYEWSDKVVLVTGGADGIGAAVVKILMTENVKHVAILDISVTLGKAMQDQLNMKYGKDMVTFIKCDVASEGQLEAAFKTMTDKFGYIDVVVNNAGIFNESYETFMREIDVNYTGVVTSTLKAIRLMRKDEGGRGGAVINVASIAGMTPIPFCPIYSGTKAGVLSFSICVGSPCYYDRTGVRVLSISYGATLTAITKKENIACFDKAMEDQYRNIFNSFPYQPPEAAGQALVDAYKFGESGSVWISSASKPAKDITKTVNKVIQMYQNDIDI